METITVTRWGSSQYLINTSTDRKGKGTTAYDASEAAAIAVKKSQVYSSYCIFGPQNVMDLIPEKLRTR